MRVENTPIFPESQEKYENEFGDHPHERGVDDVGVDLREFCPRLCGINANGFSYVEKLQFERSVALARREGGNGG